MAHARERMNDYRKVALQRNPWQRLSPQATSRIHWESRAFIQATVGAAGPAVVVTHHAPLAASLSTKHAGDLLNAAYASDLSTLIESCHPTLWVHGHMHESRDFVHDNTRIVCNPRGYGRENREFSSGFIAEVITTS